VFGGVPLPIDLGVIGAPGCSLRTGNAITMFAVTSGTGSGGGRAIIPVALPASFAGLTIYRQWAELQVTPTNALGIVGSNARQMTVQ